MDLTPPDRTRRPGTLQGIVLLLPITLAVMGIVVLVPIVPQLLAQFAGVPQVQYWVLAGVLTLPALCVALFSPLAGWLADRVGRRRLLLAAMIAYAFLGASPCVLSGLFPIIASRAGVGLCEAVIVTASTTMIADFFKGIARERWLASQTAVASLSSLVLIAGGGVLGGLFGWRGPFGLYLLALPIAAAVWRFTWEPTAAPAPETTPVLTTAPAPASQVRLRETDATGFPLLRLAGICAITVLASIMFYAIPTQCSLALNQLGISDVPTIGMLTALACLGVPVGTVVFRRSARLPVAAQLLVAFLLIGTGFLLMGRTAHWQMFILAAAINQVGCGMTLPTLLTWATRGLSFEMRGRGTGMWQSAFAFGQFLSGLAITWVADVVGGILTGFFALGLINAVLAMLALAWSAVFLSSARAPAVRTT